MRAVFLLSLTFLLFAVASCQPDYRDCDTSLSTLEKALHDTGKNKLLLNQYFYRAREEAVPYAKITYRFQDKNGSISYAKGEMCEVKYLWATGGFLFIQPPSVFTYTSLFFFHTRRIDFNLTLELPFECRGLVKKTAVHKACSCANRDNNALDLLSQQMKLYAEYSDYTDIQLGDIGLAQAECYDELDENYLKSVNVHVFMSYVFCLPLIFIVLLIVVVRSLQGVITTKLSNSLNHPNVVGMALSGVFLHFLCLGLDIAAIYFMRHEKELQDLEPQVDVRKRLNFYGTAITLTFNLLVTFAMLLCLLYLHCRHIRSAGANGRLERVFQSLLSPVFYVVFGKFDVEKFWNDITGPNNESKIRKHLAWIVCFTLLAPLFSVSSHVGYIFVAWLTKPSLALSVALVLLGVSLYLFLMFRQCYIVNQNIDINNNTNCNCLLLGYPIYQCLKCVFDFVCMFTKKTFPRSTYEPLNDPESRKDNKNFDTQAMCVSFAWGFPLVGTVAFLLSAFYKLPIASFLLPIYLLNAFQVFIVIITLLITYKVLQVTEPEIRAFMRNMKTAYRERADRATPKVQERVNMDGDEVETSGKLVGELIEVVIHELKKARVAAATPPPPP